MSGNNTLDQIAQGLYQNINIGINFSPFTWTNPAPIGVVNSNIGVFTQMNMSSLTANSVTTSTATIGYLGLTSVSIANANFQQLTTSSISTYSINGTVANLQQLINSSISTFTITGTIANFPQIQTSSISTNSIVGSNATFSQLTTSSISTFSVTGFNSLNLSQFTTSSINTNTVNGTNANFSQVVTSSISTFSAIGTTNIQQMTELIKFQANAVGNWPHNFNDGSIFYHSNIASNFTTALFNVPTTQNRGIVTTLILIQGSTPYFSSTLTVNGTPTTINWVNTALPIPTANRIECESFTLINIGGIWTALGQYNSFAPAQ